MKTPNILKEQILNNTIHEKCEEDTVMNESLPVKKRFKVVPPDGGYGYVISVAAAINLISTTMFYVCFGVIFNDFFIKLNMGSTSISLLAGIRALSMSVSGFLTGPLLKVMSRRRLALVGAIVFNSGVFGTVFVETQALFLLCQGFLQTFGIGFLYSVGSVAINDYFVQKRLISISIVNTLAAAAGMTAPMVVSWSMAEFGFRGTLVVVTAFGLQAFVGAMLLQPVAWHLKKVPDDEPEKESFLHSNEPNITSMTPIPNLVDIENSDSVNTDKEDKIESPSIKPSVMTSVKKFLDWPLFKKYARTCTCFGIPVALFTDILYIYNLAQALYTRKWSEHQVSYSFALIGFGDLVTRIFFILSSTWLKLLSNHFLYVIGLLIAIITKLAMLWVVDYTCSLGILALMGASRCIVVMIFPLVIADCVTPEEFPSALGQSMAMYGLFSIAVGPILGAIRDATDSFTIMFIIMIALFSVVTLAFSIEMLQKWRKKFVNKCV